VSDFDSVADAEYDHNHAWLDRTVGLGHRASSSPYGVAVATEFLSTPSIQRFYFTAHPGLRSVADGVTAASTTVTSATANFVAADVGATISGGSIPGGATIVSVGSTTSVTISAAATVATGVTLTITRTNTFALSSFQTAVNADFAAAFTTVPTLVTQPSAPSVALFIVSPNQVLSISPGQYVGYNYGTWQVLPASAMTGSLFTPASV
jgi:hypothetical protein